MTPTPENLKLLGWIQLHSGVWVSPSGQRFPTFEAAWKQAMLRPAQSQVGHIGSQTARKGILEGVSHPLGYQRSVGGRLAIIGCLEGSEPSY
jgi:hypothetical protein